MSTISAASSSIVPAGDGVSKSKVEEKPSKVTLLVGDYVSELNHKALVKACGTIFSTTVTGAATGGAIGACTGPEGIIPGASIGGGVGFILGCAGVGGYHYYEFRRIKKEKRDLAFYERNLSAKQTPAKTASAALTATSGETAARITIVRESAERPAEIALDKATIQAQLDEKIIALLGAAGFDYMCPLTMSLIQDPVVIPTSTKIFEKEALKTWIKNKRSCPLSRREVNKDQIADSPQYLAVMQKVAKIILDGKEGFPQFSKPELDELVKFERNWRHKKELYETAELRLLSEKLKNRQITLPQYSERIVRLSRCLNPEVTIDGIRVPSTEGASA